MMTTMTNQIVPDENWRPVAYVTMQDDAARTAIVSALERCGWAVIQHPTGFHLVQAMSGLLEGHQSWLRPSMIVIDSRARGCSGVSIAAGLRDLGITIPVVLVAGRGDATPPRSPDPALRIVDEATATPTVVDLATRGASLATRVAEIVEA
jgi:hypothetical protein